MIGGQIYSRIGRHKYKNEEAGRNLFYSGDDRFDNV